MGLFVNSIGAGMPKMTPASGNCFTNQVDKNDSYLYILYTGIIKKQAGIAWSRQ